jgi:hypothetical protein
MQTYKKQYIVNKQIKSLELSDEKTYLDNEMYLIRFYDGTEQLLSKEVIKNIADKKSYDLTQLRDKMVFPLVQKILAIITEANLKIEDINYLQERTSMTINENLKKATTIAWGMDLQERKMMDVDVMLKKNETLDKE